MSDSTYQTTSSSGGYRVNEDGTVTRIGGNGNSNNRNNSNRPNNNNQNDDNSGCVWGVIMGVIFWGVIIAGILGIIGEVINYVGSDSNDTNYVDTVAVEEVTVVEEVVEDYPQQVYTPQTTTYLNLSTQTLNVPSSGGTYEISISTDGNWHVSVGTDNWGSITTYYNSISLRISPNNSKSSRTDYFEITAGGLTRRINIYQQGNTNPSADIERIWVDHNAYQGGQYGMRIHVRFSVDNMKDKAVYVKAKFYYNDNISPIYDYYGNHLIFDNYAYPNYSASRFDDFKIFVPYNAIVLDDEIVSIGLSFDISISTSNGEQLARKRDNRFIYTTEY